MLILSANLYAEDISISVEQFTPIDISNIYDVTFSVDENTLTDFIDKEEKIDKCVEEYIKKQSKSYAKIAQNNLYDLIHNFNKITSKIYGKIPPKDDILYNEKIEVLAKVQCEVYYATKALR